MLICAHEGNRHNNYYSKKKKLRDKQKWKPNYILQQVIISWSQQVTCKMIYMTCSLTFRLTYFWMQKLFNDKQTLELSFCTVFFYNVQMTDSCWKKHYMKSLFCICHTDILIAVLYFHGTLEKILTNGNKLFLTKE